MRGLAIRQIQVGATPGPKGSNVVEGCFIGLDTTGTNSLLKAMDDYGLPPNSNVYCELGTTWREVMSNPSEAAEAYAVLEAQTKKHYDTIVLPTMGVGATDMSNIRAKGIQCYGIGPALDTEDNTLGFGAHSDQERILESELHRFVRFQYDVVIELARAK